MAESYVVRLRPDAEAQRRELTAAIILDLERIFVFLSLRPYPRRGSDLVRTESSADLRSTATLTSAFDTRSSTECSNPNQEPSAS